MRKTLLSIALIGFLFGACDNGEKQITTDMVNNPKTASGEDEDKPMPAMKFKQELYDFGTISQGEKVQFAYEFKNTGDAELIITSAQGSCGCTVPSWPKEPISPGGSGKIDIVFDSNGKSGKQHKKVTIVANTMPATNVVALTGNVVAPEKSENQ